MLGFTDPIRAVIIGGNGGVGREFVQQLQSSGQVESIVATHRSPISTEFQHPKVTWVQVDVREEATIEALAKYLKEASVKPNLIINCIGILHINQIKNPTGDIAGN